MIQGRIFLSLMALLVCLAGVLLWQARQEVLRRAVDRTPAQRQLVRHLVLTDLSIWTEARYTRHPSQADLFTPFQEFPAAPEHFPAGSLLAPPPFDLESELQVVNPDERL